MKLYVSRDHDWGGPNPWEFQRLSVYGDFPANFTVRLFTDGLEGTMTEIGSGFAVTAVSGQRHYPVTLPAITVGRVWRVMIESTGAFIPARIMAFGRELPEAYSPSQPWRDRARAA